MIDNNFIISIKYPECYFVLHNLIQNVYKFYLVKNLSETYIKRLLKLKLSNIL